MKLLFCNANTRLLTFLEAIACSVKVPRRFVIVALVSLLAFSTTTLTQGNGDKGSSPAAVAPPTPDGAALEKTANEAQARIRANQDDSDRLKRAIKLNELALAKEILLRNGFTAKDLETAKVSLRTGGGKGGEDTIEISVICCDPTEIIIRRTLENFTKAKR
jgi:hypothetical protein